MLKLPNGVKLGQTITLTFEISGTGTIAPTQGTAPAALHFFIQGAGDDWSGLGEKESYRWFSKNGIQLKEGAVTLSETIQPGR